MYRSVCTFRARGLIGLFALAVSLLGTATGARAGVLASGYLWSNDAVSMACFVLNAGSTEVEIVSSKMVDGTGATLLGYEDCAVKKKIGPGKRCGMQVTTKQAAAILVVKGSKARLRGTCQLNGTGNNIIATTPMS